MKLDKLIMKCIDALQEAANGSEEYDKTNSLSAKVETNDGMVELSYNKKKGEWLCDVTIYHDEGCQRESENLEGFLAEKLGGCVDWDAAEEHWKEYEYDEWNEHGFRDAADYWQWKEGGL